MTFFNLDFCDKNLEHLFRASSNQPEFEKHLGIIFLWTFILISFPKVNEVTIGAGIFASTTILLNYFKTTHKYFGFSFILTLTLCIFYSLTSSSLDLYFEENYQDFIRGWSLACIEVMLVSQASHLENKILTLIVSVILKFAILRDFEMLLKNILFGIFLIFMSYRSEKEQRNLFKSLHGTEEELAQLKVVLQKLSSPSLCVLDYHQTQKPLFQNQAFDTLLQTFGCSNPDSFAAFQESLQINQGQSLKDCLQKLQIHNFSGSKTWVLSGSSKTQEKSLFFDITITSIIWNKTPSILIALDNITHKKQLSDLQLAQEDKDLLIATVSHELRNPLHGILGLIQMIEPSIKKEEVPFEYLSLCKDNANLLLNLVNSLLDSQQIQHNNIKLNPSQVQIESLLKSILSLFSPQASQKNTKLSAFVQDGVPSHIITDENRLKQVLINLVANALKFTFSGSITIKINQYGQDHLRFSVTDTGCGIKREDLGKIFKFYSKLEDKEGFNKQGVGLGLAISNDIAKLLCNHQQDHGITVESQYGSGSTFSFLVHQNLNKALLLQKAHLENSAKEYFLTQQPSVQNFQDFEEFSKPADLTSKLSFYTSSPNSSSPKDSNLSHLFPKKGVSIGLEIIQRNNSTPMYFSKVLKSESRIPHPKGHILVVDDNYFNLVIAKNLIESLGYQVHTTLSGQEAIEKFEDSIQRGLSYFCIVMDCQMPAMDGFEATKILKKMMITEKIGPVPILALTANQDKNTVQKCYDVGMVEHLCKPLLKEDILRVLEKLEGSE